MRCVRWGGKHVDDLVLDNGNLPEHADFVFPNHNVICELKRLETTNGMMPKNDTSVTTITPPNPSSGPTHGWHTLINSHNEHNASAMGRQRDRVVAQTCAIDAN